MFVSWNPESAHFWVPGCVAGGQVFVPNTVPTGETHEEDRRGRTGRLGVKVVAEGRKDGTTKSTLMAESK